MTEMKGLVIGNNEYEVVDEKAREDLSSLEDKLLEFMNGGGGADNILFPFINGKRIYKNGSMISIYKEAANYGYIDFLEVQAGKEYTITPKENISFYAYSIDVNALDVEGNIEGISGGWQSETKTITTRYSYLVISYYKTDGSELPLDYVPLALSTGEVNNPYVLKTELEEYSKRQKNNINALRNIAETTETQAIIQSSNTYYVGADKTFTTINEALTQWANDGYPKATVYISNGEYNETVFVEDKDITFIGESRDGTIVRTKTGNYTYPPFKIHHGNVTVMNLTAIADHTGNPDFAYSDTATMAYAFHIDGGNVGGTVLVKNCTAISYQSPAFGMGTIPNSKIRLEDVLAISYTDAEATASLKYGCVLNHLSSPTIYEEQSEAEILELVNVQMYAKNTKDVLALKRGDNSTAEYKLLAINNVLVSGISDDVNDLVIIPSNLFTLDEGSSGNTSELLNWEV